MSIRITVVCDKPAPDPYASAGPDGTIGWGTCPARYHATTGDVARALTMAQRANWLISMGKHYCPQHNPSFLGQPSRPQGGGRG